MTFQTDPSVILWMKYPDVIRLHALVQEVETKNPDGNDEDEDEEQQRNKQSIKVTCLNRQR